MSFRYPIAKEFNYESLNPSFIPVSALKSEHFVNYSDQEQRMKILQASRVMSGESTLISNYNLNEPSKEPQHIHQQQDETKSVGDANK